MSKSADQVLEERIQQAISQVPEYNNGTEISNRTPWENLKTIASASTDTVVVSTQALSSIADVFKTVADTANGVVSVNKAIQDLKGRDKFATEMAAIYKRNPGLIPSILEEAKAST